MKPAFNNVILDLDGTLTDSAEGVYNAIGYALKEIGREVPRSQIYARTPHHRGLHAASRR